MDPGAVSTTGSGVLCLQGGRELTPPCEEMDRAVLGRTSGRGVVLAGAARPGSDYADASARTVAHYRRLGIDVTAAPDPRDDAQQALDALTDDVGLIVLPGGSPGGLLDVLISIDRGSVGARLVELWRAGCAISGASAGAMVLCATTATPDRAGSTADGLGLVPGLAVPHWSPGSERRWATPDGVVWGLPECGGVLIDGSDMVAVGQGEPAVRIDGTWRSVSRTGPDPLPT